MDLFPALETKRQQAKQCASKPTSKTSGKTGLLFDLFPNLHSFTAHESFSRIGMTSTAFLICKKVLQMNVSDNDNYIFCPYHVITVSVNLF